MTYLTEEEAKGKWCPMVQHPSTGNFSQRDARAEPWANCIGSACMMWRAKPTEIKSKIDAIRDYRNRTGASLSDAKVWSETHREEWHESSDKGYCGLAGRPE